MLGFRPAIPAARASPDRGSGNVGVEDASLQATRPTIADRLGAPDIASLSHRTVMTPQFATLSGKQQEDGAAGLAANRWAGRKMGHR
jgi:hypothetical protein